MGLRRKDYFLSSSRPGQAHSSSHILSVSRVRRRKDKERIDVESGSGGMGTDQKDGEKNQLGVGGAAFSDWFRATGAQRPL